MVCYKIAYFMINDISISYRKYIMKWMESSKRLVRDFVFQNNRKRRIFSIFFGKVHFFIKKTKKLRRKFQRKGWKNLVLWSITEKEYPADHSTPWRISPRRFLWNFTCEIQIVMNEILSMKFWRLLFPLLYFFSALPYRSILIFLLKS